MNYLNINESNYPLFIDNLYSLQDLKYREFCLNLLPKDTNLIGIRIPLLKKIAKEISKGDYLSFFRVIKNDTFEEVMLHGLVIGYLKTDFNLLLAYLDDFIPLIDNWSINDSVACNLKVFRKNYDMGFKAIKRYLKQGGYSTRFGLVLLINHYINDDYIDRLLDISFSLKSDDYYVRMADSWLIASLFIKYPDKTISYLKNNQLDIFTHNMSISKICDSYQVDDKVKDIIKKLRKS